jgi:hypothetical protein
MHDVSNGYRDVPAYLNNSSSRDQRLTSMIRASLAAILCVFAATACAVSETDLCNESGKRPSAACPRVVSTRGAGLVIGRQHVAVGWMNEFALELPDPNDCRVLIVVNDQKDVSKVQAILQTSGKDLSSICTLNTKGVK